MTDDRAARNDAETPESWAAAAGPESAYRYHLRLYVSGMTLLSERAILATQRLCEENLEGRYDLEIIDLSQNQRLAREDKILATPTLVRILPSPLRRLIGDLSNPERVLAGLGLKPA